MCRAASRPTRNALVRSVAITRSQSATSSSSIGTRCWIPALFTRISNGPTCSSTHATPRAASASLVTSNATLWTRPGAKSAAIAASAAFSRSALIPFSTTVAPASANARANALPIPRLDPVTRATRPVKSKSPLMLKLSLP